MNYTKEINDLKFTMKDVDKFEKMKKQLVPVLIRTYSAGVHIGYLQKRESTLAGIEVRLVKSRRVWYWVGAASLSQIAQSGVADPTHKDLKFAMEVDVIDLVAIEIITMTDEAMLNVSKIVPWKK